jgi:predicted phosphodiesterase
VSILNFFFVTDLHNRSERDNPKGRTDNFAHALLAKQDEIIRIVEANNVHTVLMGGDLFDRFDVPTAVINDVSAVWRRIPCGKIGVVGSHDYNGFQMKTLRRTGLGNLVVNDVMSIVGNGTDGFPDFIDVPYTRGDGVYCPVRVTGTSHSANLAHDPANFFTAEHDKHNVVIQMIHGDLFNKKVPWPHQTIDDIHPYISADVVLSGHIHSGWPSPIVVANDKSFTGRTMYINPGSLARTENGPVRDIRGFFFSVDPFLGVLEYRYIKFEDAAVHPFASDADKDKIEGSPMTDFSGLMKMISGMQLKKMDFRQHIPEIVAKTFGGETPEERQEISERVVASIEGSKE